MGLPERVNLCQICVSVQNFNGLEMSDFVKKNKSVISSAGKGLEIKSGSPEIKSGLKKGVLRAAHPHIHLPV